MIIDFDKQNEQQLDAFKGGEKYYCMKAFSDERNKIMLGRLVPGASIGVHTHESDSEIIFVISGEGKVYYDGKYETVCAGQCHYCPMGHQHSLINNSNSDLIFYAVVAKQ